MAIVFLGNEALLQKSTEPFEMFKVVNNFCAVGFITHTDRKYYGLLRKLLASMKVG